MQAEPSKAAGHKSEWDVIAQTIEFCTAQSHAAPASPVGKTTLDFLQLVQRNGAPGQILVADVSGYLGKKAPYFVLGEQPFEIKAWEHYCSSGLHNIEKRRGHGCLRRIETLAAETTGHVMVDLDTAKICYDSMPSRSAENPGGSRVAPTENERKVAMQWLFDHGYTTAITPHGFHTYLIPSRPLLIRQAERELEPFVKGVFADFPWESAGLKLDRCSWSRLNGERISPIVLWRPETVVAVPHDLPRILYDSRDRRVGISLAGIVTPWRTFQRKGATKADTGAGLPPVAAPNPSPTFGLSTPMLGDKCGRIPSTSAEKHEACSKALGMRARYLAWGLLDERTHGDNDFVWQEVDAFVTGVSDAVGLPPDEIAEIFNRFAPEQGKSQPDLWGKLNVPCHKVYCGENLPIRSPKSTKQHYAEFARSIYVFPFHGFSLAQTMTISRRYFELLQNPKANPRAALELALARETKNDGFVAMSRALTAYEAGIAEGLASLLDDTAALLGGQDSLFRWLDTDCPRLCRKFWSSPWKNSCEVSRAEIEKVLLVVRKVCAHNANYQFSTAEIARQAGITATPKSEKWLAVAREAHAAKGQKPPINGKSLVERRVESAHHKTQVALQLLGCQVVATGIKNPNRPGCKAKRQAPAAILSPSWIVPEKESSSSPLPTTSICPSNSTDHLPLTLREVDLVDGLGRYCGLYG